MPVITFFKYLRTKNCTYQCQENGRSYLNPALFAEGQMELTNMSFLITKTGAAGEQWFVGLDIMTRIIICQEKKPWNRPEFVTLSDLTVRSGTVSQFDHYSTLPLMERRLISVDILKYLKKTKRV
jgi:hypothetical protein